MKKTFLWKIAIIAVSIFLFATNAFCFVFWPAIEVEIIVTDMAAIQKGDPVYMNGQAIGKVLKARLEKPDRGTINVKIDGDFKKFITDSAVFTIARDHRDSRGKCLLVKNCLENRPVVKSGHRFQGYSRYRYETACLEKKAAEAWEDHFLKLMQEVIASAGELSDETIERLRAFEAEHRDKFAKWADQMKKEMQDLEPEVRRQLDELLKEFGDPEDTTPETDPDTENSGSQQINT